MENLQENKGDKVSWFEFLLKEDLLEEHLAQSNPDPSAADLIGVFLQQAEVAVNTARDIAEKEHLSLNNDLKAEKDVIIENKPQCLPVDSKKAHALRLLAIKAVAFLKWDLNLLEKNVPLPVSHEVLKEVVGITTPPEQTKTPHAQLELHMIPDEMFFALQLYYRWWVRSVVKEGFCSRPSKAVNVQVPGLIDTSVITAASRESITKMIHDGIEEAMKMLEQLLNASRTVVMPSSKTFGTLNETTNTVTHDWRVGEHLSADALRLQMSYDFACINFSRGNMEKAGKYFNDTQRISKKVEKNDFVKVDEARLRGYCAACGISDNSAPSKLFTRVENTRQQQFEGVVGQLQEDNQRHELNLEYRLSLEEDIRPLRPPGNMMFRVSACNVVRRLQEGQTASPDFLHELQTAPPDSMLFFLKVCEDALKGGSYTQKAGVKNFLRYLGQVMPDNKLVHEQLSEHFTLEEWEELGRLHSQSQHKYLNTMSSSKATDPFLRHSELRKKLLSSYEPMEIRQLISQLSEGMDRHSIVSLTDKWFLPHDMSSNLDNIKGLDGTYAHILIAKAKICSDLKLFEKVRELLHKADPIVKDASYNLSRLIRWEVLLVDLLQFHQQRSFAGGQTLKDLAKKAKTCITSLQLEQDLRPRYEIIANCAIFLLTTKDWDYLMSITDINNGAFQLTSLIGALCKELPLVKGSRKPARELWEAVIMIFTSSQQQKRTSGGAACVVQRQAGLGIMAQQDFIQYICLLQDPVAISAMISCLTKLFNLVKDDISCEISSDYTFLWPTALGSSGMQNVAAVSEAVKTIMAHALKVNRTQPSWVRTQADIHFGHNQYAQALKYYLEAGAVATDFFAEPVPKAIFDDTVYKRMIKCCSYLQCQSQVAVLCQFLDDVDYTTAFKSMQDRNSHDAMDAYYDYFWDISMLEFLINLHQRRGELHKKQMALEVIGQLELNSSNPTEILNEAEKLRKTRFLRALGKQYM